MNLISLQNAFFGYDGKIILNDVSFEIQEGDFIGLIGENGTGKSTLIKGLAGLLPPLRGSVTHAPGVKGGIGYVPQRGQLDAIYPLTAFDVVKMGLCVNRSWFRRLNAADRADIQAQLEKVAMEDRQHISYATMSGGQQQRVLIARALATHPRILMLDEPTAGVDLIAEEGIMDLLLDINKKQNIAIILVSHKLHVLERFVNKVLLTGKNGVRVGAAKEWLAPGRLAEIVKEFL